MSAVSGAFSAIGGALGLSPRIGRQRLPRRRKELGRLSLAELTEQREAARGQLGAAESQLGAQEAKTRDREATLDPESATARILGRAGERRRGALAGRKAGATTRLQSVSAARQSLIRRGTAARSGRATAISTLLSRGI